MYWLITDIPSFSLFAVRSSQFAETTNPAKNSCLLCDFGVGIGVCYVIVVMHAGVVLEVKLQKAFLVV